MTSNFYCYATAAEIRIDDDNDDDCGGAGGGISLLHPSSKLVARLLKFTYLFRHEWVSSFLTAHQHIIGYFSALQWCEYRDKIVEI